MQVDICVVTRKNGNLPRGLENIPNIGNVLIETSTPLGEARRRAITRVKTEWFMFIDDDIILSPTTFTTLAKHMAHDIGAIQGDPEIIGLGSKWDESLSRYAHKDGVYYIKLGQGGNASILLMKAEAVRDWEPSRPDLSAYEDYELAQHVLKKGYHWVGVPVDAKHVRSWKKTAKSATWGAQGWKKSLRPTLSQRLKRVLTFAIAPFVMLKNFRDVRLFMYQCWVSFFVIVGLVT